MALTSLPLAKSTMAENCKPLSQPHDGQALHPEGASGSMPRHPASLSHVIPTMRRASGLGVDGTNRTNRIRHAFNP